jgi:hypothetical protein
VAQAAGVVIRRLDRQRVLRLDRPQFEQEFANVAHFSCNGFALLAAEEMAVILQDRPAAAGVVDDRIDGIELAAEHLTVGVRQLLRLRDQPRMIMQRPAAHLPARNPHVAAVALEHARRGDRRLREERIGGAADEQHHLRAAFPLRGQQFRQPAVVRLQGRHDLLHRPERTRQEAAQAVHKAAQADALQQPQRGEHPAHSPAVRRQVKQHPPLKPVERRRRRQQLRHVLLVRADDLAVLHA